MNGTLPELQPHDVPDSISRHFVRRVIPLLERTDKQRFNAYFIDTSVSKQ